MNDAVVKASGLGELRASAGLHQLMVPIHPGKGGRYLTIALASASSAGPEATMHVPRGLQGSLPAGREEEGRGHRTGNLPSRVQSPGEHFKPLASPP